MTLVMKKGMDYLKKHPAYNASIHALGGLGVGMIVASTIASSHIVLWGMALIVVSLLGHLYAWVG